MKTNFLKTLAAAAIGLAVISSASIADEARKSGETVVDAPGAYVRTEGRDTKVEAPFTEVDEGHGETHIRAPFVDITVPGGR